MDQNKKVILLVEDEAIIALMETQQLRDAGYEVLTATSGEKAIELVRADKDSIDLILMDINLGRGLDGTEAASEILETRDIPVVFLSSHTEKEVVEKTEAITSYGYVVKNSGEIVLLASIRMAFRLFEAHRSIKRQNREIEAANEELRAANEDLSQTKNRLLYWNDLMEDVIQHDPSAIAVLDRNLIYKYVSRRYLTDYCIAEQDIIGRHHYDVFPEIPERWREVHRRALAGEILSNEDDLFVRQDGSMDYISWESRPWYESDDTVGGIVLYTEVITERKRNEERLRSSDRIFNYALDLLCVAGYDGWFKVLNPSWSRTLGWSIEELLAKPWIEFVHPDDRELTLNAGSTLIEGRELHQFENRYLCRDGSIRWLAWNSYSYPEEHLIYAVARDITERRNDEQNLLESEKRLQLALEGTEAGFCDWDTRSNRFVFSPQWKSMLGYRDDEIPDTYSGWRDLWHPDEAPSIERAQQEYLSGGSDRYEIVHRLRHRNGEWRWILAKGRILRDDAGQAYRWVGTNIDITERMRTEEALQKTVTQKEMLMKELQHRVKNNLSVITSLLSLEMHKITDASSKQVLSDARARIQAMMIIYSRLHHSDDPEQVELAPYLEDLCRSMFRTYNVNSQKIRLQTHFSNMKLETRRAIPLGLLVNELITNALKYAFPAESPGDVRITLSRTDDMITLEVSDNGVGLPANFDVEAAESTGFMLVKALTAQLEGTLSVKTGNGTALSLRFAATA